MSPSRREAEPAFLTTRWSMVLSAGDGASPEAARALEALCQGYWYPLFAYVRRTGRPVADAEDLQSTTIRGIRAIRGFHRRFSG
jgi:DNA-directed RNA polymerase specialized sigma24 family protein